MTEKFPHIQAPTSGDIRRITVLPAEGASKPTDLQLWREFQSGSESSFTIIYRDNAARLYSYGKKLVNDKELVMDAIQDLFVELWDAKERLGQVESIKSYLYRSIRRKIIAPAGKQRNHTFEISDSLLEPSHSIEHSLIEKQRFDQERRELKKALSNLNPNQREIIHLKYHAQLNYQEIAEIMGTDKKAIYNLMARTIHQLRQHWGTLAALGLMMDLLHPWAKA